MNVADSPVAEEDKKMNTRKIFCLVALGVVAAFLVGLAGPTFADWEPPPPPKPSRIKAGEGLPPLPLPATPLRRSERKREPAKPALIGKIQYGKKVWASRWWKKWKLGCVSLVVRKLISRFVHQIKM